MNIHPIDMDTSPPKYLLSGASGMLGAALQQALVHHSRTFLRLVRHQPASPSQISWNPTADLTHQLPIEHPEALEGLAAAIHFGGANVAAHRWTPAYKREITLSRVQSTHALATTLARLRHPPQAFLVASAVGFYGTRGAELLDETSEPGFGFLADVCRKWEAAARPAVDAGIRVVHLRLGVVLGLSSGPLHRAVSLFRLGLGGPLGSGLQWMSWISLVDFLAAVLFILDTPALVGPVNLTSPNPVTNAQFTRALASALHRPAILPAPAFALRLILGQMADEALLTSARAYPAKLSSAGFQFTHTTIAEALESALSK